MPAPALDSHDARQISRRTRSSRRVPRGACIASASERSSLFFILYTWHTAAALRIFIIHKAYFFCNHISTYTLHAKNSELYIVVFSNHGTHATTHCVRARLGVRHFSGQISGPFCRQTAGQQSYPSIYFVDDFYPI